MGIDNYKFTEADFDNQGITNLPDRPNEAGFSATQLKARFDNIPKIVMALGKLNGFFDFLKTGQAGADIGVMNGENETKLQDALDSLNQDKITSNPPIVGATKPKITYDSKGLVTSGEDLEKSDLPNDTLYEDSIINAITSSRTDKITSEKAIVDYVTDLGGGDMTKAIYDPTGKKHQRF